MLIPGLFQTPDYARVWLESLPGVTPGKVEERLKGRMARQQRVLFRDDPPEAWFLVSITSLRNMPADVAGGQLRHLLEVASLVTEATGGADPNLVIAALLHDAIEDQGVTTDVLASEFGQDVADIVMEVSDDRTLPKDERKRKQVENAGVHRADLVGVMIPQDPIDVLDGLTNIVAISPVDGPQPLPGMEVVQRHRPWSE